MNIRPDIEEFVARLEKYAKQRLSFPAEIGMLLQISMLSGRTDEFEELCFQAKFLVRTNEIMKRIGPGADGFGKLSAEFQSGVQKAKDILKNLVQESPADIKVMFNESFINMQTKSFHRFVDLLMDLSWIKNWQIDGNPMPYEKKTTGLMNLTEEGSADKISSSLIQIERSALMALVLLILLFIIDSPVMLFGWILSLGIMVFLVYIILQVYILIRTPKS